MPRSGRTARCSPAEASHRARIAQGYRAVGEVEVDARRRVSLGKLGRPEHTRYSVNEGPDGELLLVPVRSIPAREAIVWENPQLLASLKRGMEQAALGQVKDLGSFAQYVDEE